MDIESIVIRLQELSKNEDVEVYVFSREIMGMTGDHLLVDEKIVEYYSIRNKLITNLNDEICKRSSSIFGSINERDFCLSDIRHQLDKLAYPHWHSRTEIEILRHCCPIKIGLRIAVPLCC